MERKGELVPLRERHITKDEVVSAILEGTQFGGVGSTLVGAFKGSPETVLMGVIIAFASQTVYLSPIYKRMISDIKTDIKNRAASKEM